MNCLLEDSTGVVWAGTAAGLAFGGSNGFQTPKGLPNKLRDQILGIAEDRHGWLWLATSNHVVRVKRDKLLRGALSEGDLHEYGLADGLRGVEGVKRHQSVFADSMEDMVFDESGISVVESQRLTSTARSRHCPHSEHSGRWPPDQRVGSGEDSWRQRTNHIWLCRFKPFGP